MADFDLTLTGEQVQQRLNLVPQHADAIAAIQEAIQAFVNSEQVQTLINTALEPYSTTTQMNAAINTAITSALTAYYTKTVIDNLLANKVDKVSGKQLSTEDFTSALKTKLDALPTAANLSTQISTAISNALKDYYTKTQTDTELAKKQDTISDLATIRSKANAAAPQSTTYTKTEVDSLLAPKQTAAQVSSAIASALTSYSTTTQMNSAISTALGSYYTKSQVDAKLGDKVDTSTYNAAMSGVQQRVSDLEEAVSGLEVLAEGYIRVAGSSAPALSYAHYKYNQEGAFAQDSAFSLFYPVLVGTKLTGDDAQVGKILHILQKTDWLHDLTGNARLLDGSEGDVMVANIEKYYQIAGKYTVGGTEFDVFLIARTPFNWQGIDAEEKGINASSPDFCVAHLDTDGVTRMHCVYNPAWEGSYTAPVGITGKYIFSQNEETGVISEVFDANATMLGGAGGLHSTNINLPTGEQYAMNQNPDTTTTVPFSNHHAEACNLLQSLLLAEGGTFDAHNARLMGSGFSSNDKANETTFTEAGSEARNGLRYESAQGGIKYLGFDVATPFNLNVGYSGQMINDWRSPWHILEAQRAVSHAIRNNVGELQWFVFEGNKYKYRSVDGFNGPSKGEMTCVLFKQMSAQFTQDAIDPEAGVELTGKRIDFIVTTALFHGIRTDVSPSWWESGLIFTEDENGDYEMYIERDQEQLLKSPTADIDAAAQYNFETAYQHVGETIANGNGYAKNYLNGALMLPDTNANKSGGGLHTYVGKYNWFTGSAAPAGKKSVRGFRRGLSAGHSGLSPLSMHGINSPSHAFSGIGFGTCCKIR